MKRFEFWLTTVIMFSLPALLSAQATGGSPGKQGRLIKNGTAAGTGRKGTVEPEIRKKGSGNAQKKGITLNPPPPTIIHAYDKGGGDAQKKGGPQPTPPTIIHAYDKGGGNAQKKGGLRPTPPTIIHAYDKGGGNAQKITGSTPPPKAGTSTGKVYRKGSGTGRKGKVEQTDTDKKLIQK